MHFLLDLTSRSSAGGERLQRALARAVGRKRPNGCRVTVLRGPGSKSLEGGSNLEEVLVGSEKRGLVQRARWLRTGVSAIAERLRADVVFPASGFFARRLAQRHAIVATTNNMLPFTPDLSTRDSRPRLWLKRQTTLRCLELADRVVLHSAFALERISHYMPELASKTTVVLSGIPEDIRFDPELAEHPFEGRPYFFYLSPLKPYKNHLRLVEAYSRVAERDRDVPTLLFAGQVSSRAYLRSIRAAVERLGLGQKVRYLGELERSTIASWLHHATANFFPSLCETNSVIQAEILGCHGVMAASKQFAEVGGPAMLAFDPASTDAVARAMERLWREPELRSQLRQAARLRAAELSWDTCGAALWDSAQEAFRLAELRGLTI